MLQPALPGAFGFRVFRSIPSGIFFFPCRMLASVYDRLIEERSVDWWSSWQIPSRPVVVLLQDVDAAIHQHGTPSSQQQRLTCWSSCFLSPAGRESVRSSASCSVALAEGSELWCAKLLLTHQLYSATYDTTTIIDGRAVVHVDHLESLLWIVD